MPPAEMPDGHEQLEARYERRRAQMVDEQLIARGIRDPAVLEAFRSVPRHRFVPDEFLDSAYTDAPLPIGFGQTISQPLMVAEMLVQLAVRPGHRILDVGTGSGYQAALLQTLGATVRGVERIAALATAAHERLASLGFEIPIRVGDGSLGLPEHAPFDRILVAAASPELPRPLVHQLARSGRLVLPLGSRELQTLTVVERGRDGNILQWQAGNCTFVPLIGASGWSA